MKKEQSPRGEHCSPAKFTEKQKGRPLVAPTKRDKKIITYYESDSAAKQDLANEE